MKILRTLQTAGAQDSDVVLLDNWPKDRNADGLYLDVAMPVNVGVAGTPATSDLKNLLAFFLAELSLKYGLEGEFKALIAVSGTKLRNIHRLMTQREVFNDFVGVAQTVGNKTFRARLFYTPNRQKARGPRRFIGATMGKTIEIEVKEGAALTGGALTLTRNGATPCIVQIVPAFRVGPDQFTHLPHYREINRDALDLLGPDGKTLGFWDDNAAFASTAIGKHTITVGGRVLVDLVEPKYVDEDYAREIDQGGADITDEVTLLHVADPFMEEDAIPTGPVYLELVNQDVATIKGRFVYLPAIDDADAAKIVDQATQVRGEAVAAVLPPAPADPARNGHQATAPLELVARSDDRYNALPSLRSEEDGAIRVNIPAHAVGAAIGQPRAVSRIQQKVTALRVPGSTGTRGRGNRGKVRDAVRGAFGELF